MKRIIGNIITNSIYQIMILGVLAIFIVSKPIVKSFFELSDIKLEISENSEEDTEDEEIEDFEDDILNEYVEKNYHFDNQSKQYLLFFNIENLRNDFNPDIPIPPPKFV